MNKINSPYPILEFGSTHIRLAVYDKQILNQSSFYEEKVNYTRNENSKNEQAITNIISKAENDLSQHLKEILLLIDSSSIYSLDFSIQKNFDKKIINKTDIDHLINESENIIKLHNKDKDILHIIKNQIMIDDKIFDEKNEIIIEAQKVTIDLKFVLIEKKTCDLIRELFLKKHITLKSIYCTSYIKSLEIIKKNQISGYVSFIDIGLKKSSLTIFQDSKLLYLNNTYIGGHHITNDIVKVLNLDYRKAEAEKFKFSKSNKCEDITINKSDDKMLRKIINARLEEIIELLFLNCPLINNFNFNSDLKLYFIGNGSKVLSENLLSFGPEFSFLKEMSIINETAKDSCDSALKYSNDEMEIRSQKTSINFENKGLFEKLFNYFTEK